MNLDPNDPLLWAPADLIDVEPLADFELIREWERALIRCAEVVASDNTSPLTPAASTSQLTYTEQRRYREGLTIEEIGDLIIRTRKRNYAMTCRYTPHEGSDLLTSAISNLAWPLPLAGPSILDHGPARDHEILGLEPDEDYPLGVPIERDSHVHLRLYPGHRDALEEHATPSPTGRIRVQWAATRVYTPLEAALDMAQAHPRYLGPALQIMCGQQYGGDPLTEWQGRVAAATI